MQRHVTHTVPYLFLLLSLSPVDYADSLCNPYSSALYRLSSQLERRMILVTPGQQCSHADHIVKSKVIACYTKVFDFNYERMKM